MRVAGVHELLQALLAGSLVLAADRGSLLDLHAEGNKVYDLKSGGVDYSTTGGKIDDIKAKIDDYKQQIIDGKIKVPTTP